MQVKYNMVIDFVRPSKTNTLIVSEGDVDSRLCHFTLLDDKKAFDMVGAVSATVRGVKEDGSVIFGDATILVDDNDNLLNIIEYTIPESMADTAGKVTMTITLMSDVGESITSFEFYVIVRNSLYNEDDYISDDDLNGFRDVMNRCLAALETMETMTSQNALPCPYPLTINLEGASIAYNGSGFVEVTFGNMVYISDDEVTGEDSVDESAAAKAVEAANNALTYSQSAQSSAQSAAQSAESIGDEVEDAEAWAKGQRGGINVPSSDETYHNNAKYYADLAKKYYEMIIEILPKTQDGE